jgi:hypothetical protein
MPAIATQTPPDFAVEHAKAALSFARQQHTSERVWKDASGLNWDGFDWLLATFLHLVVGGGLLALGHVREWDGMLWLLAGITGSWATRMGIWLARDRPNSIRLSPAPFWVFVSYRSALRSLSKQQRQTEEAQWALARWEDMVTWARRYDELTAGLDPVRRDLTPAVSQAWEEADGLLTQMAEVSGRACAIHSRAAWQQEQARLAALDAQVAARLRR